MNLLIVVLSILTIYFTSGLNAGKQSDEMLVLVSPCSYIVRDVVFILDASESISKNDFKLAQTFIVQMMTFVKNSNMENRIAFIIFGDSADVVFNLKKVDKLDEMIETVKASKNENGLTAIGKALNLTWIELYPTMRKEVEKLIILFTDGTNNVFPAPYIYADKLKDASVQIMTIGIGSDINNKELNTIATKGLAIQVQSFTGLVQSQGQITSHLCPIPDPGLDIPCSLTQQDLVIVLDSSDSIDEKDYLKAKEFLIKLFSTLELGPDKARVAMISFSDELRFDFDFNQYYNIQSLTNKIKSLKKFGSLTGIGKALKEVELKLKPKQRAGVPFNILLMTDGVNNIYPRPLGIANSLKKDGANIIALGIGDEINLNELKAISSDDKILTVETFDDLKKSMKTVLKSITCG